MFHAFKFEFGLGSSIFCETERKAEKTILMCDRARVKFFCHGVLFYGFDVFLPSYSTSIFQHQRTKPRLLKSNLLRKDPVQTSTGSTKNNSHCDQKFCTLSCCTVPFEIGISLRCWLSRVGVADCNAAWKPTSAPAPSRWHRFSIPDRKIFRWQKWLAVAHNN
jgi:hypothetical protein